MKLPEHLRRELGKTASILDEAMDMINRPEPDFAKAAIKLQAVTDAFQDLTGVFAEHAVKHPVRELTHG